MISKVVFLAVAASVALGYPDDVTHDDGYSRWIQSHEEGYSYEEPAHKLAHDGGYEEAKGYSFGYEVNDAYSGNNYGHSEASAGGMVTGMYHVLLPDGHVQTVSYTADHEHGYVAKVTYSKPQSYHEPSDIFVAPNAVYEAPEESYEAPEVNYSAPKEIYESQKISYDAHDATYNAPETPRKANSQPKVDYRASVYSSPKSSYHIPLSSWPMKYSTPKETYESPKVSYDAPDATYNTAKTPRKAYSTPKVNYRAPVYSSPTSSYYIPLSS